MFSGRDVGSEALQGPVRSTKTTLRFFCIVALPGIGQTTPIVFAMLPSVYPLRSTPSRTVHIPPRPGRSLPGCSFQYPCSVYSTRIPCRRVRPHERANHRSRTRAPTGAFNLVTISPENVTLGPAQQQKFTATVTGTSNTSVSWSISPNFGLVSQAGIYTAPGSVTGAPAVTITATSIADPTKSASTAINFYDPSSASAGSGPGSAYPIQGTFLNFYRNLTPELWALEFHYMKEININTIVIVSVGQLQQNTDGTYSLSPTGLLYPSNSLAPSVRPSTDLLELLLSLADSQEMDVYLGTLQTATNWTDGTEFTALQQYNHQVASEILSRYGRHASFKGWYFPQEIWMNWVKYYGGSNYDASTYYGTTLLQNWVSDMKSLDPARLTTAAAVVKETGSGSMPGLSASELQQWFGSFLQLTNLDIIMPQDGQGAQQGAPPLSDLPSYFSAMSAATQAAGTNTALWSTIETFSYVSGLSGEQYPPADSGRIQQQVSSVRPYVTGYVSWIFGDDMSQQATYYPVEASELDRRYKYTLNPQTPNYDFIPLQSYQFSSQPSSQYPDSYGNTKLSDRTGGGYNDAYSLSTWVGFANDNFGDATLQVTADLGSVRPVSAVRALTLSWASSGIFHPDYFYVEYSQDLVNWNPFGSANQFPPDANSYSPMWGEVDGSASARYVRWTFSYREWLMLAELEVIGTQ